ncbi:hypothetical protein N601_17745 [Rhodococcus erythropolis DN1]|nr:hypothetical protein N601_17745 [Rhodococcus erythropolis DN1]
MDEDNLALIESIAVDNDFQVWVEVVVDRGGQARRNRQWSMWIGCGVLECVRCLDSDGAFAAQKPRLNWQF